MEKAKNKQITLIKNKNQCYKIKKNSNMKNCNK